MTAQKALLLIIDGVSDRPCADLGNRTPLQAARTPVLDRIAEEGVSLMCACSDLPILVVEDDSVNRFLVSYAFHRQSLQ